MACLPVAGLTINSKSSLISIAFFKIQTHRFFGTYPALILRFGFEIVPRPWNRWLVFGREVTDRAGINPIHTVEKYAATHRTYRHCRSRL